MMCNIPSAGQVVNSGAMFYIILILVLFIFGMAISSALCLFTSGVLPVLEVGWTTRDACFCLQGRPVASLSSICFRLIRNILCIFAIFVCLWHGYIFECFPCVLNLETYFSLDY